MIHKRLYQYLRWMLVIQYGLDNGDKRITQALETQKGHQHLNSDIIVPQLQPKLHRQNHDFKTSLFLLRPCRVLG